VDRLFLSIVAVASAAGVAGVSSRSVSRSASMEGVWRTAAVTITGPGARTIDKLQPSLQIITAKHYSRVELHAEGPRPAILDASKATADELRQVWGPVVAEAGSHETSRGNTLTMRPVVAKNPASMTPGTFTTYSYRLVGDTLWLTPQANQRGPVTNPPTIKLTRVE
jgi:hypothetical protein